MTRWCIWIGRICIGSRSDDWIVGSLDFRIMTSYCWSSSGPERLQVLLGSLDQSSSDHLSSVYRGHKIPDSFTPSSSTYLSTETLKS